MSGRAVKPLKDLNLSKIHNAVPANEPKSPYGNPKSYVVDGKRYHVLKSSKCYHARGYASWYGPGFDGHRTSDGDTYDMYSMTAANKVLPLPSFVRVTNLENHRSVIVKVNDRGPFHPGRIIDLSYVAAAKLGIVGDGSALVEVDGIDPGDPRKTRDCGSKSKNAQHPSGLYLQTGAFSQRSDAHNQLRKIISAGLKNAFILKPSKSQSYYRVRLGPYASPSARDKASNNLNAMGISSMDISK